MTTRIVFNGQEYASLDAMPPDVRQAYDQVIKQLGDADHDGTPDIIQPGAAGNLIGVKRINTMITVNTKKYGSADEMPPDVRALYDKAMASAPGRQGGGGGQVASTVQARFVAKTGDRAWTFRVTGRQLVNWGLLLLLALAAALVYASARHR
jgi:hypothetical protein